MKTKNLGFYLILLISLSNIISVIGTIEYSNNVRRMTEDEQRYEESRKLLDESLEVLGHIIKKAFPHYAEMIREFNEMTEHQRNEITYRLEDLLEEAQNYDPRDPVQNEIVIEKFNELSPRLRYALIQQSLIGGIVNGVVSGAAGGASGLLSGIVKGGAQGAGDALKKGGLQGALSAPLGAIEGGIKGALSGLLGGGAKGGLIGGINGLFGKDSAVILNLLGLGQSTAGSHFLGGIFVKNGDKFGIDVPLLIDYIKQATPVLLNVVHVVDKDNELTNLLVSLAQPLGDLLAGKVEAFDELKKSLPLLFTLLADPQSSVSILLKKFLPLGLMLLGIKDPNNTIVALLNSVSGTILQYFQHTIKLWPMIKSVLNQLATPLADPTTPLYQVVHKLIGIGAGLLGVHDPQGSLIGLVQTIANDILGFLGGKQNLIEYLKTLGVHLLTPLLDNSTPLSQIVNKLIGIGLHFLGLSDPNGELSGLVQKIATALMDLLNGKSKLFDTLKGLGLDFTTLLQDPHTVLSQVVNKLIALGLEILKVDDPNGAFMSLLATLSKNATDFLQGKTKLIPFIISSLQLLTAPLSDKTSPIYMVVQKLVQIALGIFNISDPKGQVVDLISSLGNLLEGVLGGKIHLLDAIKQLLVDLAAPLTDKTSAIYQLTQYFVNLLLKFAAVSDTNGDLMNLINSIASSITQVGAGGAIKDMVAKIEPIIMAALNDTNSVLYQTLNNVIQKVLGYFKITDPKNSIMGIIIKGTPLIMEFLEGKVNVMGLMSKGSSLVMGQLFDKTSPLNQFLGKLMAILGHKEGSRKFQRPYYNNDFYYEQQQQQQQY